MMGHAVAVHDERHLGPLVHHVGGVRVQDEVGAAVDQLELVAHTPGRLEDDIAVLQRQIGHVLHVAEQGPGLVLVDHLEPELDEAAVGQQGHQVDLGPVDRFQVFGRHRGGAVDGRVGGRTGTARPTARPPGEGGQPDRGQATAIEQGEPAGRAGGLAPTSSAGSGPVSGSVDDAHRAPCPQPISGVTDRLAEKASKYISVLAPVAGHRAQAESGDVGRSAGQRL